jgi:hypothetical protein
MYVQGALEPPSSKLSSKNEPPISFRRKSHEEKATEARYVVR